MSSERRQQKESPTSRYALVFGASRQMAEVRDLVARVADTDVTVLLRGESGTGKELVARQIHAESRRADKPFVKVNCAALPGELLESELFGFERGAFTGAIHQKPGKFEFANHGTMFLDEIGEMNPLLQAKLLQVLQDNEFSRLGSSADVRVDVRVISATNQDLEAAVASWRFREDLFFRLNVVSIALPPLRERLEDLQPLAEFFLERLGLQYNRPRLGLPADLLWLFHRYTWPGNVRELENAIKRLVIFGNDTVVRAELERAIDAAGAEPVMSAGRPDGAGSASPPARPRDEAGASSYGGPGEAGTDQVGPEQDRGDEGAVSLRAVARSAAREAERELIRRTLQKTRWNRKEAASLLGISYKALLYKIKENGLDAVS